MTVQTLELKTSLQTRLTQRMQQAIKLLQLNHLELQEVIETYIEENPLLEINDQESDASGDDFFDEESPLNDLYDADFDNYYPDDRKSYKSLSDDDFNMFESYTRPQSFREFVQEQINLVMDTSDRPLACELSELLDDFGYLPENYRELLSGSYAESDVERVLLKLQTLEPIGIFARSFEECLLLQLREKGCDHPKMEEFLHELSSQKGDISKISRILNISIEGCHALLGLLKPLNPKPALSFSGSEEHMTVVPDLLMKRKGNGAWGVELNPAVLPKVYFDQNYYLSLKGKMKNLSDRHYLQDKFQEGKWLLKSLQQRAVNMQKIADVIVEKQMDFFKSSRGTIKPLTLREVAFETDLSESTVSRVTTSKYIQTPRGTLELKYFFSSVASDHADDQSAKGVQQAIKAMIDKENPTHPLSDSEIAEKLSLQGMAIARRTVAKYRDILKIDNVSDRKRFYEWRQTGSQKGAMGA